jgi:hypothetical protein
MNRIFLLVLTFFYLYACKKEEDSGEINIAELKFVKSIALDSLERNENLQRLDVFNNGEILVNTHSPALNAISHICRFTSEGNYIGRFADTISGTNVTLYNFFIDGSNNFQAFSMVNYGSPQLRNYSSGGTYIGSQSVSTLVFDGAMQLFLGHWAFAFDSDENLYSVSSNTADIFSEIVKIKSDYSEILIRLTIDEIKNFFPNQNGEQIRLTDIAIDKNNIVYITIDRISEDSDRDKDGILVLNSNLEFVKFIGSNWAFNGPSSICFDISEKMYVLNMYAKEIKVFNADMDLVAKFNNTTEEYILASPSKIIVKGGYVYVLDYKEGRKVLQIFEN